VADKDAHQDGSATEGNPSPGEHKVAVQTVTAEMKKVAREAAIAALAPRVKGVVTSLVASLATQAPGLYKQYLEPMLDDAGGLSAFGKKFTGQGDAKRTILGEVIRRTDNVDE
jgi:hypothetical protein